MTDIIYLTDVARITCIVDKGLTDDVLHAASNVGARGAIVQSAHGWGVRERLGVWGVAVETDKDVIHFVVSTDQQDLIFDAVYQAAGLDVPGRGFLFITRLDRAATYVPEAIRNQLERDRT